MLIIRLPLGAKVRVIILLWFTFSSRGFAQDWPEVDEWQPVIAPNGEVLQDLKNDHGGGQIVSDIVGNPTYPAGYFHDDGTNVYFRVRLADTPQQSDSKWKSFAFFAMQETDGDVTSNT